MLIVMVLAAGCGGAGECPLAGWTWNGAGSELGNYESELLEYTFKTDGTGSWRSSSSGYDALSRFNFTYDQKSATLTFLDETACMASGYTEPGVWHLAFNGCKAFIFQVMRDPCLTRRNNIIGSYMVRP